LVDCEELRTALIGREGKVKEILQDNFGVALKWCLGKEDGGRLQLQGESDVRELLDNMEQAVINMNKDPKQLDRLCPFHTSTVEITTCWKLLFSDARDPVMKWLQRELGVTIKITRDIGKVFMEAKSVDFDLIQLFEMRSRQIVADPLGFQREITALGLKKIHVFVDVSNILIGSKRDIVTGENDHAIRLDARNLLELVTGLRTAAKKVVIGSHPSKDSPMWDKWREVGWSDIRILDRMTTMDGRSGEQAVDDCLHAAMSSDICCTYPEQRTLVLLTGDGNTNSGRTNFPAVIEMALLRGWDVELWSWGHSMHAVYDRFKDTYPQHFNLRTLDSHRSSVCYRVVGQGGGLHGAHGVGNGGGTGTNGHGNKYVNGQRKVGTRGDFEVVATPADVARRLHDYIVATFPERHCSAFDLGRFYERHPECKPVLRELGASTFCSQEYARHLLRWEHGSHFPGNGRLHALPTNGTNGHSPSHSHSHNYTNGHGHGHGHDRKPAAYVSNGSMTFPEYAAKQLHDFILTYEPHQGYINAADMSVFYQENPQCHDLIADLRVSSFCSQPYARHLLRWEHEPTVPGCGRVHALRSGGAHGSDGAVASRRRGPADPNGAERTSEMSEDYLTCPISLDVMSDPVITPYGDSFERYAIIDWLRTNDTCPLTRRPLKVSQLMENKSLKLVIEEYQRAQQQKEYDRQQKELQVLQLQQLQAQVEQLILSTKAGVAAEPHLSSHSPLAALAPPEPAYHSTLSSQPYRSPYPAAAPPPPPPPTDNDRMIQSLRQQNQWMEKQHQQGANQYAKAAGGGPSTHADQYSSDGDDEVISTALICPSGPQCRKPEGCDLYHWPMRLCDYDSKVRPNSNTDLSFIACHHLTFYLLLLWYRADERRQNVHEKPARHVRVFAHGADSVHCPRRVQQDGRDQEGRVPDVSVRREAAGAAREGRVPAVRGAGGGVSSGRGPGGHVRRRAVGRRVVRVRDGVPRGMQQVALAEPHVRHGRHVHAVQQDDVHLPAHAAEEIHGVGVGREPPGREETGVQDSSQRGEEVRNRRAVVSSMDTFSHRFFNRFTPQTAVK
jgi:hypothetical protein